jgi:hypothetical protein
MKLSRTTKILLVGGVAVATIGGIALAMSGGGGGGLPSITILCGSQGIVSGDYLARAEPYVFDTETIITIGPATATGTVPFFAWEDSTGKILSTLPTFQITVNRPGMRVYAVFTESSIIPTRLKTTKGTATCKYLLQVWKTGYQPNTALDYFRCGVRNDKWQDAFVDDFVEFSLEDDVGNGVVGEPVVASIQPYSSTYPFIQYMLYDPIHSLFHTTDPSQPAGTMSGPVVHNTNSDGKVIIPCRIMWKPDNPELDYGILGTVGTAEAISQTALYNIGHWPITTEMIVGQEVPALPTEWWTTFGYKNMDNQNSYFIVPLFNPNQTVNAYWLNNSSYASNASVIAEMWMPPDQTLEVYSGKYEPVRNPLFPPPTW